MNYAPIIIFAFNRLEPLKATVASVLRNTEAAESDLYVFVEWYTFLKRVGRLDMCRRVLGFICKGFNFFLF